MVRSAPRPQPVPEPERQEAVPEKTTQPEAQRSPEVYELTEEDRKRIDTEMGKIESALKENVKLEGFFGNLSGTERIALSILRDYFRESLESTLRNSEQRRRVSRETASGLTEEYVPEYLEVAEESKMHIGRLENIAREYRREPGKSRGDRDKVPPSEVLARMNISAGGYEQLFVPSENETQEEMVKRENILAFLRESMDMGGPEDIKPSAQEIAQYISEEIGKGDTGFMPYLWIAMGSSNDSRKREITREYIKMIGDTESAKDEIRRFLTEGNERGVFPPALMKEFFPGFSPEDMQKFSENWERIETFTEAESSPDNIWGDRKLLGTVGIQLWGTVTALANIMASMSGKSPGEAIRSILSNPYVYAGVGAVGLGSYLRKGPGEKSLENREAAEKMQIGRTALISSLNHSTQIHEFLSGAGNNENFERGKFFLDYAKAIGEGEDASCEDFLKYLRRRKEGTGSDEVYGKIIEDFEKNLGEGNPVTNRALNSMILAFRAFDSAEHIDFLKIFREGEGGVIKYREFVEKIRSESNE